MTHRSTLLAANAPGPKADGADCTWAAITGALDEPGASGDLVGGLVGLSVVLVLVVVLVVQLARAARRARTGRGGFIVPWWISLSAWRRGVERMEAERQRLLAVGLPTVARVLRVEKAESEMSVSRNWTPHYTRNLRWQMFALHVKITHPVTGASYETAFRTMVKLEWMMGARATISPGALVAVRVDPADPTNVGLEVVGVGEGGAQGAHAPGSEVYPSPHLVSDNWAGKADWQLARSRSYERIWSIFSPVLAVIVVASLLIAASLPVWSLGGTAVRFADRVAARHDRCGARAR